MVRLPTTPTAPPPVPATPGRVALVAVLAGVVFGTVIGLSAGRWSSGLLAGGVYGLLNGVIAVRRRRRALTRTSAPVPSAPAPPVR